MASKADQTRRRRAERASARWPVVSALGDSAVLITLGATIDAALSARVHALAEAMRRAGPAGCLDVVPAFASVALFFKPGFAPPVSTISGLVEQALSSLGEAAAPARRVDVPVVYGGEWGPDLAALAQRAGMTEAQVIAEHTAGEYLVHAVGFAPGFPYLGGLSPKLATPRRATPRPRVPAGSVGIGGAQTGVYPLESPGGWNLIGRTPARLFDATRAEPALLRLGDQVRFRSVHEADFSSEKAEAENIPHAGDDSHTIQVLRPGMLTTVQDLGRHGHRAQGLPSGGAADTFAMRVANLLVGNDGGEAGLEWTLVGPELHFKRDTVIAVCGAEFDAVPGWRPLAISAGQTVNFGAARRGCRGFLAIAGGVDVPAVLGSRSTYVRASLGGFGGRALRAGDAIPTRPCERRLKQSGWFVDPRVLPGYFGPARLRVVRGAHRDEFADHALDGPFVVSRQSDRMGARLDGPKLERNSTQELLSAAVAPGTIQVPPDGQPIVLLADAQTIGGYPQIAHVAAVDWPIIAQRRPGESVQFEWITLEEAAALADERERVLAILGARMKEHWK